MISLLKNSEIVDFFQILQKENPNPQTELKYSNHYTLLVAVVLSAQATDKGVNKATQKLFASVDQPQAMLNLGINKLTAYIKSIGLYKTKAKNIIELSKILVNDFQSTIPSNRDDLEKLPGVGRKTANVILNVAFNYPTMAVDTHIFRISNRIGIALGKTPLAVENNLLAVVPKDFLLKAHHWLILHGRYTCKAQKPQCSICKVSHICHYFKNASNNVCSILR